MFVVPDVLGMSVVFKFMFRGEMARTFVNNGRLLLNSANSIFVFSYLQRKINSFDFNLYTIQIHQLCPNFRLFLFLKGRLIFVINFYVHYAHRG